MQRSTLTAARRRSILIALLAGWPVAVIMGLVLNHLLSSHAPSALLPLAWLLALATWIQFTHADR
jgi:hypothetical protein